MSRGTPPALIRLRVCHEAGIAPEPEVIAAVLAHFEREEACAHLRACRNERIRRAAALLDGVPWARAEVLATTAARLERMWATLSKRAPEAGTVRGELHAARLYGPLPESRRSFLRVLQGGENC